MPLSADIVDVEFKLPVARLMFKLVFRALPAAEKESSVARNAVAVDADAPDA